jgi:FtsP/CotA-like multicopper oxidase with cupredoxin domain
MSQQGGYSAVALPSHGPSVDRELLTIWDEWDIDGDGRYDTHTINTRSTPDEEPLTAKVGEKVRLVMANVGFEVHAPHMHGVKWTVIDPSVLRTPLAKNTTGC